MGSQKVHFTLTDEALDIIAQRAEGPNKRGEWLSAAVLHYDQILAGEPAAVDATTGTLEQIISRLAQLEQIIRAQVTQVRP